MFSFNINTVNSFKKCYHIIVRRNFGYLTVSPRFIGQLVTSSKFPEICVNNNGLMKDSNDFTISSSDPSSPSEVVKCYQLLRSKLKGYDDLEFLEKLSRKTLSNITKLTSEELVDITEILTSLKYRNVFLMHAITEKLYWMCKIRKVKLQHITKFLKFSIRLKFIPNVRYLDVFFKKIDDIKHKKTVGDYLRLLQFLVASDLWVYERYIKLYLKLYEHCVNNLGFMPHGNLSSFSQILITIDNSNTELFERICMNFEREVEKSEVKHLRMLCNSLLKSRINQLPIAFNRVVKYYSNFRKDEFIPNLSIDTLNLYVKYYYRDTEILNKLGNIISENLTDYTPSQLSILLNGFSTFSYKHKELIRAITKYITGYEIGNPIVNLSLISSLSNLISKTKFHHITSINSINHLSTLLTTNNTADIIDSTNNNKCGNHLMNAEMGLKRIITTSDVIKSSPTPIQNLVDSTKTHKSILRKLSRNFSNSYKMMDKTKPSELRGTLKYIPVSTDIIKVQTLSECLGQFYEKFFNGVHPANGRLTRRKLMIHQLNSSNTSGSNSSNNFEVNKSLSKVYNEKRYSNNYNTSIRRVKYKMRYSGSRVVQPTTYYINEVKILKRLFLSKLTRKLLNSSLINHKYTMVNGIIGNGNDVYYVDTGVINNIQYSKLKYKTKSKVWKELSLLKPVKDVIDYLIDNNKWIHHEKSTIPIVKRVQRSELEYLTSIISSLSRMNFISFPLTNSLLQNFNKFFYKMYNKEDFDGCLRFLNSFNILLTSIKPIILNDRSSTILNSVSQLLNSEEFEEVINEYLKGKNVQRSILNKLLHNLSFITLFKHMEHPKGLEVKEINNLENILNIMYKIIKSYNNNGDSSVTTDDKVDSFEWLNNLSYVFWLFNNEENIGRDGMCEEVGKIMNNEISKIIGKLRIKNCETSFIKYYLNIIKNYQILLNNSNINVCLEELMGKYEVNEKMINNTVVGNFKLKNSLTYFKKIMEIIKINSTIFHGDTQLRNFYYYYYN